MENAKQKAIEVAYGEHWYKVKNFVDENGWVESGHWGVEPKLIQVSDNFQGEKEKKEDDRNPDYFLWRPKSLDGIETNNNWISINSEEDLPKETGYVEVISRLGSFTGKDKSQGIDFYYTGDNNNNSEWVKKYSHWKPIIKSSKPIY